jgi:hypothetical protein
MEKFAIGFIGVLVGAIVTIGVYWHSRYSSAKQSFYNRLSVLFQDVYYECAQGDIYKIWNPTIKEFLPLYNDVMRFALPWQRRGIREAWQKYKGENQDVMVGLAHELPDSKMFPMDKQEFKQRITSLLTALK